ncbi:LUD domain-containing protein [Desulfothermus sp.]
MLEKFIFYSKLVGNKNYLVKEHDFSQKEFEHHYDIVWLPSFSFLKMLDVGKNGISSAIVEADYGIAETGSVVINSLDFQLRKTTCLAEKLDIVVFRSKIVESLEDIEEFLRDLTRKNAYIAFITGASRTADIERVLTIGVHGPCETNIFIVEDR